MTRMPSRRSFASRRACAPSAGSRSAGCPSRSAREGRSAAGGRACGFPGRPGCGPPSTRSPTAAGRARALPARWQFRLRSRRAWRWCRRRRAAMPASGRMLMRSRKSRQDSDLGGAHAQAPRACGANSRAMMAVPSTADGLGQQDAVARCACGACRSDRGGGPCRPSCRPPPAGGRRR
ncbi:MAG: hypothetical protein MZV70_60545 [Desulfobacterales bacterium]|nr:hypothetical protein [Desulfobacterales bacterium]